jgi:hypothetical protein
MPEASIIQPSTSQGFDWTEPRKATPQEAQEQAAITQAALARIQKAREVRAEEIYQSGEFIEYCREVFKKMWLGDQHILEGLMYLAAAMRLDNADEGMHLHVSGTTQSGKSDSVKTALKLISPNNVMQKSFSKMYLFHGNLRENTILFHDEKIDKDVAEIYRNLLTSWHDGVTRGIVDKNLKPLDLTIPRHVSLVLTSVDNVVEESEDGQDESRFLTIEVRRTKDREKEIRGFVQEEKENYIDMIRIAQLTWDCIPTSLVKIHRKVEKDIPIREFKRYLTLIKCHALLCNRQVTTEDDVASIDKFLSYSKPMIDSTTPAYTRKEAVVVGILTKEWTTVAEIKERTGLSIQNVYRAIRGVEGTFFKPHGGLMLKEKRLDMMQNPDTKEFSFRLRV